MKGLFQKQRVGVSLSSEMSINELKDHAERALLSRSPVFHLLQKITVCECSVWCPIRQGGKAVMQGGEVKQENIKLGAKNSLRVAWRREKGGGGRLIEKWAISRPHTDFLQQQGKNSGYPSPKALDNMIQQNNDCRLGCQASCLGSLQLITFITLAPDAKKL